MPRRPTSGPTELESQVLRLLWNDGECTVRQIHDWLVEQRGVEHRYTSTVKMLHVMLDKELVDRDDSIRPQKYRALASEQKTQRSMLKDLVTRIYDGSSASVIMQALSDKSITHEELAKIREMIDRREGKK